jgi:hypothetical protein
MLQIYFDRATQGWYIGHAKKGRYTGGISKL